MCLLLCCLLLSVNVLFIWGNSGLPADVSNQLSQSVMEVLEKILQHPLFEKVSVRIINTMNRLLNTTIPNEDVGGTLLRKMAHFLEFSVLGLNLCWFFQILEQKGIHKFTMPLLSGMLVALIDETIQLYSVGRSASLVDVWIDTGGLILGASLLLAVQYLIGAFKNCHIFRRK